MPAYLIDAQVWLWSLEDDPRLSPTARALLVDDTADLVFSVASVWEVCIKTSIGKLRLPGVPVQFIPKQLSENRLRVLPVEMRHALAVYELPLLHSDPFDRILIAQAQVEGLHILTGDSHIRRYNVKTIW